MTSRNELFNACTEAAVQNIKKELKLSTFVSCLPAAVQKDKEFCESLHKTLVEKVTANIRDSTQELSQKVGLKHKLDLLDKIVSDPANATPDGSSAAWRPPPNHLDNQSSRDRGSVEAAKDKLDRDVVSGLNSALKAVEREVTSLGADVDATAEEISRVIAAISAGDEAQSVEQ